jgi:hypothetical protein
MSGDTGDKDSEGFGFAPPPFKPDAALQRVQRELRALGLVERAGTFERRGIAMARVAVDGAALKAQVVKKPSRNSPVWQAQALASDGAVSRFCSDLKKQLAAWSDSDD